MSTHKKQQRFFLQPVSLACMVLVAFSASNVSAAPIDLSQQPAGNSGREPAPNVIISVDNSGSMSWDANGGTSPSTTNPSRLTSLKEALNSQFVTLDTAGNPRVSNNRIRLAWQSMWVNSGGDAGSDSLVLGAVNSMKRLDDTHRANFSTFVTNLTAAQGTPSHKMMLNAYDYMKSPAGTNSPWADNPGTAQSTDYLACRRTYHIFMTDGAWNSQNNTTHNIGNQDGTAIPALPISHPSLNIPTGTPTSYTPFTNQTALYSDRWGGETRTTQNCTWRGCTNTTNTYASTLADFAFRSWAEDLQPGIDNKIKPLMRVEANEDVGATPLQPFWNPRNDPATWQHITQHTIGFGSGAASWTGAPIWDAPNATTGYLGDSNYGVNGDYSRLVNGAVTWQEPVIAQNARESELWHMALNGRGKFYPSRDANSLTNAFSDILDNILADTSKPLVSIAANGTRLKSGLYAYQAGYDGKNWAGRLLAYPINATTGIIGTTAAWNAATLLDAPSSVTDRFVASYNGTTGINWNTFPTTDPVTDPFWIPLSKNSSGTVDHTIANNYGQKRVDYIRGDRSNEQSQPGGIFRNRGSRLGDIVNSNILYVGAPAADYGDAAYLTFKGTTTPGVGSRTHMLYVGANDGMLHGFEAGTGVEKLAYIPQGIAQGKLRDLTDTTYTHKYFVDGTPFVGDAKVGGTAWKTVLVSGLSGGGKGYVALDASNPTNFTTLKAADLVIADTTATTDPDIGNMYITPANQIVRLNAPESGTAPNQIKHRWALVLGNGYNSANEAPVLVVQYLDGAKEIKKISPCIEVAAPFDFIPACTFKTGNGLSTPRLVDLNNDQIYDVAYAGDLKGNVWKFDLSSEDNANWKTSFTNAPFFKAKPGQAFTTAPYVVPHPIFGMQVQIGSGRNLTTEDQSAPDKGTIYSLHDNSSYGNVAVTPATTPPSTRLNIVDSTPINTTSSATMPTSLVQQTIDATTFIDGGITYYTSSSNPVNYRGTNAKRGWYMDWTVDGQRVLQNATPFDGEKIRISSTVPNSTVGSSTEETCNPRTTGERSFLWVLNMFNGNPSKSPVYDLTPSSATDNPGTAGMESNPGGDTIGLTTENGEKIVTTCLEGQVCTPPIELKYGKYVGARANWREKQ